MTTFNIPAKIEDAAESLGQLGELVNATEWKRAAIVYAFTRHGRVGSAGPDGMIGSEDQLTPTQFAKLGIYGLRGHETVRRYRHAWVNAVLAEEVKPAIAGKRIDLPEAEWTDFFSWEKTVTGEERPEPETEAEAEGATVTPLHPADAVKEAVEALAEGIEPVIVPTTPPAPARELTTAEKRATYLNGLLDLAEELNANLTGFTNEFGRKVRSRADVEVVHKISAILSDVQWTVVNLAPGMTEQEQAEAEQAKSDAPLDVETVETEEATTTE